MNTSLRCYPKKLGRKGRYWTIGVCSSYCLRFHSWGLWIRKNEVIFCVAYKIRLDGCSEKLTWAKNGNYIQLIIPLSPDNILIAPAKLGFHRHNTHIHYSNQATPFIAVRVDEETNRRLYFKIALSFLFCSPHETPSFLSSCDNSEHITNLLNIEGAHTREGGKINILATSQWLPNIKKKEKKSSQLPIERDKTSPEEMFPTNTEFRFI